MRLGRDYDVNVRFEQRGGNSVVVVQAEAAGVAPVPQCLAAVKKLFNKEGQGGDIYGLPREQLIRGITLEPWNANKAQAEKKATQKGVRLSYNGKKKVVLMAGNEEMTKAQYLSLGRELGVIIRGNNKDGRPIRGRERGGWGGRGGGYGGGYGGGGDGYGGDGGYGGGGYGGGRGRGRGRGRGGGGGGW